MSTDWDNEINTGKGEEENESLEIDLKDRKIYTEQGDPEIDSLKRKYEDKDLDIQPSFQRGFVWDITKASRLIESILLDIPLPVIYLSQEKDGREYVIDGQQRLTSFFSFINGILPDNKPFKLTGLRVFTELNGKLYGELPKEYQKKIRYYHIRTITFKKESIPDLKFEIFERLNTGAVSLNDQELRNCIYRGKYNDLLKELSEDVTFRKLIGLKNPEKRMRDVELVLRFAAFFFNGYQNYRSPMKRFLNYEMEKNRNISDEDAARLKSGFKNTVWIIFSLLGEHGFKRFHRGDQYNRNGRWEKKQFNASLFDILMDSFARRDKSIVYKNLDFYKEAYLDMLSTDDEFIESIEKNTSSSAAIQTRFSKWNERLASITPPHLREPRLFSFELKKQLFELSSKCEICGNNINTIDDAAVDHIKEYWKGGETIPENARLTHRYCNFASERGGLLPELQPPEPDNNRRRFKKGCTVNGRYFLSGKAAFDDLKEKGMLKGVSVPHEEMSFNAHDWLKRHQSMCGYEYERDK